MKKLLLSILALGTLIVPAVSYSMFVRIAQRGSRPRLGTYRVGRPGLDVRARASELLAGAALGLGGTSLFCMIVKTIADVYPTPGNKIKQYKNELVRLQEEMEKLPERMKAKEKELQESIENVNQVIEEVKYKQRLGKFYIQQRKNNIKNSKL